VDHLPTSHFSRFKTDGGILVGIMDELCWIDGAIVPLGEARVSVDDRGYVFADGVYEVLRVYAGKAFAVDRHLQRLSRSCEGIEIALPQSRERIAGIIQQLVSESRLADGIVYLQVTRGVAPRGHAFPIDTPPTLIAYTRAMSFTRLARQRVISVDDDRWQRCWIKSIALLPNVLAKQKAVRAGADEAIFVDGGAVQEGSTSNVAIVVGKTLVTPPVGKKVLPGVTRAVLIEVARSIGMDVEERAFTLEEAYAADEAFVTSTTREVAWIAEWDGRAIGPGACGPWTGRLSEAFDRYRVQSD
jgi:D-alanine transaminase